MNWLFFHSYRFKLQFCRYGLRRRLRPSPKKRHYRPKIYLCPPVLRTCPLQRKPRYVIKFPHFTCCNRTVYHLQIQINQSRCRNQLHSHRLPFENDNLSANNNVKQLPVGYVTSKSNVRTLCLHSHCECFKTTGQCVHRIILYCIFIIYSPLICRYQNKVTCVKFH